MSLLQKGKEMIAFGLMIAGALLIEHWIGAVLIAAGVVCVLAR